MTIEADRIAPARETVPIAPLRAFRTETFYAPVTPWTAAQYQMVRGPRDLPETCSMAGHRHPTVGFTLVELLVAIAIIAVLMALTLPALKRATEAARLTVCATNLKEQHTAIYAIAIERQSGRLPTCDWGQTVIGILPGVGGYRGDQWGMFSHELIAYGYTKELGFCPSVTPDTGGLARRTFWYAFDNTNNNYHPNISNNGTDYLYTGGASNYPMNSGYTGGPAKPPDYGFIYGKVGGKYISLDILIDNQGRERTPSALIYIGDIAYNDARSYPGWWYGFMGYKDPSNHRDEHVTTRIGKSIWPSQGRGANHLTADGAVSWVDFPVKFRTRGTRMPGAYMSDYYTSYW